MPSSSLDESWPENKEEQFKELNKLASPLGRMVQIFEKCGYDIETTLSHDKTTASMIVFPKRQNEHATFHMHIQNIDLTKDLTKEIGQATGTLMINGVTVTKENKEQMEHQHKKILGKAWDIMDVINKPGRGIKMLDKTEEYTH